MLKLFGKCVPSLKNSAPFKMGNSKSHRHDRKMPMMPQNVKEFHVAVMMNDRETVKNLIADGVNVNFPWYNPSNPSVKDGSTPLIIAVSLNHIEIIEVLIKSGAYINKCDGMGCTPVYKASFHGRPFLIELLSKAGADVNLSDYLGKTPLYICVNNCIVHSTMGKVSVQRLLSAGAIVDKRDKAGQAPIHLAAHWKLVAILKLLLAAQSDVNLVDKKGRTPLYICVSSLSTKLYIEDIKHQLPSIITLFNAGADMLNFIEWLHFKGSGLTWELLKVFEDSEKLWQWYQKECAKPMTLKNMCRKVIQRSLTHKGPLVDLSRTLPLPTSVRQIICRRMFYREVNHGHYYGQSNHIDYTTS